MNKVLTFINIIIPALKIQILRLKSLHLQKFQKKKGRNKQKEIQIQKQ